MSGIDLKQFKHLIVEPVLSNFFGGKRDNVVNLLVGTALCESELTYIEQLDTPRKDGGIGFFQMEAKDHDDIHKRYLYRNPHGFLDIVKKASISYLLPLENLSLNVVYQVVMARIHYYRVPYDIPENDFVKMAKYYKNYYNTLLGKADVDKCQSRFKEAILA